MGSAPLGAGTGRPDESVYVQSLDAKKLGNREEGRQRVRTFAHGAESSPIATWSWFPKGRQCRYLGIEGKPSAPVPSHRRLLL